MPILLLTLALAFAPVSAPPSADAPASQPRWVLEFGPYAGVYDFDPEIFYESWAVFGLRGSARLSSLLMLDVEFDEVYTSRRESDSLARQISLAFHLRAEPLPGFFSPTLFVGGAIVSLDDAELADAVAAALDLGLGARLRLGRRWSLRGEGLLRYQRFDLRRKVAGLADPPVSLHDEYRGVWSRSVRLGVFYAF